MPAPTGGRIARQSATKRWVAHGRGGEGGTANLSDGRTGISIGITGILTGGTTGVARMIGNPIRGAETPIGSLIGSGETVTVTGILMLLGESMPPAGMRA